ncbi:Ref family recombination enhancement nuclease [Stutzerimonas nitrititolerans]|uniref:Ref family recombination enhancement nuclease n=1 Tax=Stutzerimonas nitrititolerans TaxID=2482751 RepID=UPI0028A97FA6|nr:Ref family recombination enhancement nuclease [Stutzerimonas nitrititolerans]
MKGRNPSAAEKRYHDKLCTMVGCIACRKEGHHNTHVSVHHVDGRTKPMAHWLVLPLCAGHHQDGYGPVPMIAVHPYKARFEAKYGRQLDLVAECASLLVEQGIELPLEIQELTGVSHVLA